MDLKYNEKKTILKSMKDNFTVKDEIIKLEARLLLVDASKEADTRPIIRELIHDNGFIISPHGEIYTKDFIIETHGPGRIMFENVSVDDMEIECYPDMAVVTSINTYYVGGEAFRLRFFRVWNKIAGSWFMMGGSTIKMES